MTKLTKIIVTMALGLLVGVAPMKQLAHAQAQDELPQREYVSPDELVSLSKDMSFGEAVDVLNEYAQRHVGKFVIDRSGTSSSINIPIRKMHWKDALQNIVYVKGLQMVETLRFFEIKEPSADSEMGMDQRDRIRDRAESEKKLSFGSREVRIKAVFFEGNKRALREIGVDWSTLNNLGNRPENLSQIMDPLGGGGVNNTLPDATFGGDYVEVNSRAAQQVSQNLFSGVVNLGDIGHGVEVRALFSAFEADNLGKILATPSIKVLEGQEGRIQVGQDFSIKQRDFAGNIIDRFFSVGTILTVTPQIVHEGDSSFIHMVVSAERSTAQPDPVSTIVNKQHANSEILLLNGESTVIAGLFRTEVNKVRKGIPLLKDLPGWFFGLKYLFGYNSDENIERELVILINAAVEPMLTERMEKRLEQSDDVMQKYRKEQQFNEVTRDKVMQEEMK